MEARPRSSTTLFWSTGVGLCGALALALAGIAFTTMLGVVGTFVGVVTTVHPLDTGPIARVTALAAAVCLVVSCGGGWLVAGAADGLTPRWLAGLTTGLIGVGVGAVVLSLGLGLTPF